MKTTVITPHKSSLGMDANIASLVIYIAMAVVSWIPYLGWFAWAVPLVFFFLEKQSKFVKFQAVQALVIGIVRAVLAILFQIIVWALTPKDLYGALNYLTGRGWGAWALFGTISTIIAVIITLIIVYALYQAYRWKQVELPLIGPIAAKASAKLDTVDLSKVRGFSQAGGSQANDAQPAGRFCPKCGKENAPGAGFCSGCGEKL
ncbi:MAG: zinc-ribbon domain-containing protein [Defluviitaleaceae bacterium]|nr:zinc-ribbon domain-containing protein [Defluviitaleaceae bacterium]